MKFQYQSQVIVNYLASSDFFVYSNVDAKDRNDHMALACIAQFRYLDVVYNSRQFFNSIFECDLEGWRCTPRDSLIQSLPEIIPVVTVQQGNSSIFCLLFYFNQNY